MSIDTLTIEKVEREFAIWRDNKKGQPQIPAALCNQVKILLQSHKHSKVLRRLGLSMEQARNKGLLPLPVVTEPCVSAPFVKIPIVEPTIHSVAPGTTLTLQRGDMKLSLNCPSHEQIQLIINTLLR